MSGAWRNLFTAMEGIILVSVITGSSWGQLSVPTAAVSGVKAERLVPAAMGIRTDKQGNSWNIEQNGNLGRVGNSMMVNSGLNL